MPSNLFSVIIPCYNYAQYLPKAINSVIKQSGDDFEIIIIDDGSTDNTEETIAPILTENNKLNYIYQPNKGSAAARNLGVKNSDAEYLIFLDADDELLPDSLSIFRQNILKHPDKHFLLGGHQTINAKGKERKKLLGDFSLSTKEELFAAYLFKKLSISAGAYAMHHTIFDILKFPEQLRSTEDIPMYAQTLALFDTTIINQPLVKIYKHTDSLRHNFSFANKIGTDMVGILFDATILPANFMKYKHQYYLKRCLSLSGLAYRAGSYSQARKWYLAAITFDKRALLKISRLKKFFFSYFKKNTF